MAEEVKESPTLEQTPQESVKEIPPQEDIDVDALLGTLKKANALEQKALEGKLEASTQAGRLANQLGDARAEIARLTQALQEGDRRPQRRQRDDYGLDDYDGGSTVDLEALVAKATEKSVESAINKYTQRQMQAQQQAQQTWNAITGHRTYPLVKEVWEQKMSDPNLIMKVNQGQVDLSREYFETVVDFLTNATKQSYETINKLRGKPGPAQPHLESAGTRGQPQNLVNESGVEVTPERKKQVDLLQKVEKGYQASDDEVLDTFGGLIDDIFKRPSG